MADRRPRIYSYTDETEVKRLGRPVLRPLVPVSGWHDYGFVLLGSVGFLDQITVTASRFAQAVAVEHRDAFDQRFDTGLSDAD